MPLNNHCAQQLLDAAIDSADEPMIEAYVQELDALLANKAAALASLRQRVEDFKREHMVLADDDDDDQ